jgi:HAD superfamily hydrolase (TIGR01509 family)
LGGVLARIRRTWQECAAAAGVDTGLPQEQPFELTDFPLFDAFQLGAVPTNEYLRDLAGYLFVDEAQAKAVHNAILDSPYEGTRELVGDLKQLGHATACLSNTNALHWEILNSEAFPAIHALDYKVVSHSVRLLKPEAAVFRLFDLDTQVTPEYVVFFDDHEGNVLAARRHGWNAIFVDHESDPAAQMRAALAAMEVIPSPS